MAYKYIYTDNEFSEILVIAKRYANSQQTILEDECYYTSAQDIFSSLKNEGDV